MKSVVFDGLMRVPHILELFLSVDLWAFAQRRIRQLVKSPVVPVVRWLFIFVGIITAMFRPAYFRSVFASITSDSNMFGAMGVAVVHVAFAVYNRRRLARIAEQFMNFPPGLRSLFKFVHRKHYSTVLFPRSPIDRRANLLHFGLNLLSGLPRALSPLTLVAFTYFVSFADFHTYLATIVLLVATLLVVLRADYNNRVSLLISGIVFAVFCSAVRKAFPGEPLASTVLNTAVKPFKFVHLLPASISGTAAVGLLVGDWFCLNREQPWWMPYLYLLMHAWAGPWLTMAARAMLLIGLYLLSSPYLELSVLDRVLTTARQDRKLQTEQAKKAS
eukprot:TRINITY_DN8666_c0_g1_i2.p1 TRINITY_DN8666_c0_g1~~TRINITY_DN8666_c0_g1_i2.p1  ORF type:complete len:331 (+),score=76.55 TRINITY_DN8666_c0_g1_i2:380-1372(+)